MTAESFDRALDELYQVKPFKIFSIVLKGGEVFEIDYPRALSFRDGYGVFLAPGGRTIYFDHDSVLQLHKEKLPSL